jgi:hypothetical protein
MIIGKKHMDERGDEWRLAGYSSPRRRRNPTVYRFIRMADGARVRIPSTKFYCCQISRDAARDWFDVPTGTDEKAHGPGAASIEEDWRRVGYAAT